MSEDTFGLIRAYTGALIGMLLLTAKVLWI